ncbi:MAG TPA: hypothetical protein VGK64_20300 [Bryobacteraceae bacterium]
MTTLKGELAGFQHLHDLKTLLSAAGPCLSVYMPLSTASAAGMNPKENGLRWEQGIRTLKERAEQFGPAGRELVDSVSNWDAIAPDQTGKPGPSAAIAVFRSADLFQIVLLDEEVAARAVLGPRFYIRPLLPELAKARRFYLLALSQKNVRLLRCTTRSSEEVSFPADVKADFESWMNQAKPDHTAVNNAMAAAAQGGSGPNALAPKGADREAKNEYLSHFFKQIDRGVNQVLKGRAAPLVLCGVEYELPIYREVNHYPHLLPIDVRGAANGLKSGEMHSRALAALQAAYAAKVDEALAEWNHRAGGGASNRLKDVVTAAHDGRVVTLLVSDSQEQTGTFNEATHQVKGRATGSTEDEDLVNDAVVQTILHAGDVLVAPHAKMPNGNALAAIFRYS